MDIAALKASAEAMGVSRDDAIKFLEGACRNWSKVPPLSEDDIGDVATELLRFVISRANPTSILAFAKRYEAMEEALLDQIPTHRSPLAMCWCHMSRDIAGYGHADNCLKARAVFSEPVQS